jgi:Lrp/AsnC family transcriptional regulator, leucine-responsive regulatory protein
MVSAEDRFFQCSAQSPQTEGSSRVAVATNVSLVINTIQEKPLLSRVGGMKPLDEIDRRILRTLQEDARLSNVDLAQRVGLSASPCWQRVKRLEEEGVIAGYITILDQKKLGRPDTVMIEVTLERHDDEAIERFGKALTALPEVLEAYLTAGGYDYFIKVAVDGTEGYERFLRERLYKIRGVRQTRSSFTLRCLKRSFSVIP